MTKRINQLTPDDWDRAFIGLPREENQLKASESQVGGSHYNERPLQPIDYILANGLGFIEGNVVKYVTRHKDKGGKEDIKKAIHYLELLLEKYDDNV